MKNCLVFSTFIWIRQFNNYFMRGTMKAYQSFLNSLLRPRMARSTISATRCHSVTIVWVCLVSFATLTLCIAFQWAFFSMCAKCDLQCLIWREKTCRKLGFKLCETALEILEMELVFTITTQKPNSNPQLKSLQEAGQVTPDICDWWWQHF